MHNIIRISIVSLLLLIGTSMPCACSDDNALTQDLGASALDGKGPDRRVLKTEFGGSRKVTLSVPTTYDGSTALPLVVLLHGYSANGWAQERYLGYSKLYESEGFLLVSPDGTLDTTGKRFWNATDACCNFYGSTVNDSQYLASLIDEVAAEYKVDKKRVFFIGHSNGGFMSFRMACDHADRIAALISLAGATYKTSTLCTPKGKVSVVQVHGTKDEAVAYSGGTLSGLGGTVTYPSARDTVKTWATYNGCQATTTTDATKLDLDSFQDGTETLVERHQGCPTGIDAELWTIQNGTHVPILTTAFAVNTWAFFKKHPKP